jgi:hypothetical protein
MTVTIHRIGELQWEIRFRLSAGPACEITGELEIETEPGHELTQELAEALVRKYREPAIRMVMRAGRKDRA